LYFGILGIRLPLVVLVRMELVKKWVCGENMEKHLMALVKKMRLNEFSIL
jgi:hypothetical protein